MKRKEKGNTRSIRALVDPRNITMVSVAYTSVDRVGKGWIHFESKETESKNTDLESEKSQKPSIWIQIGQRNTELDLNRIEKCQTLTLKKKGLRVLLAVTTVGQRRTAKTPTAPLTGAWHRPDLRVSAGSERAPPPARSTAARSRQRERAR